MILTNQQNNSDVQVVKDNNEEQEGYTKLQEVVRELVTSCSASSSECVTNLVYIPSREPWRVVGGLCLSSTPVFQQHTLSTPRSRGKPCTQHISLVPGTSHLQIFITCGINNNYGGPGNSHISDVNSSSWQWSSMCTCTIQVVNFSLVAIFSLQYHAKCCACGWYPTYGKICLEHYTSAYMNAHRRASREAS